MSTKNIQKWFSRFSMVRVLDSVSRVLDFMVRVSRFYVLWFVFLDSMVRVSMVRVSMVRVSIWSMV